MDGIKAGVTLMTKWVDASSSKFGGYIDYIDREEAVRNDNIEKFNSYMDYMGNPEKTSALFTAQKDNLNADEQAALKADFASAQNNKSLMWQTVISFDNRWLAENGLYDMETQTLDEDKIMEYTRGCMNLMLKEEGMMNSAFWSASIHYNTDNIHVHIATSEIQSERRKGIKSTYYFSPRWCQENDVIIIDSMQNYEKTVDRERVKRLCEEAGLPPGRWFNFQCDNKGGIIGDILTDESISKEETPDFLRLLHEEESYIGKWKLGTINKGKGYIINQSEQQREMNMLINNVIRGSILERRKSMKIQEDADLKEMFLNIFYSLPEDKRQWNYASNTLGNAGRDKLDMLSKAFLDKYFVSELKELSSLLQKQEENYRRAYGEGAENTNFFAENKMKDLYKRLGNSILKEMREYDKNIKTQEKRERERTVEVSNGDRANRGKNIQTGKSNKRKRSGRIGSNHELDRALRMLRKSMEKDLQNYKNQMIYETLTNEVEYQNHEQKL